jgi:AcrR family transcriptional regulator
MLVRTNNPHATRRRVVDAAFEAFVSDGYNATAMHDLRDRAGVSAGALAHHFPTKKSLGLAVIRDRVARAIEETWIAPVRDAATASEGIAASLNAVIADLSDKKVIRGCPLNNLALELSVQDADMRRELDAVFRRWRQEYAGKLSQGVFGAGEPERLATFVVAAISGAIAMAKTMQSVAPLVQCRDALARIFRE